MLDFKSAALSDMTHETAGQDRLNDIQQFQSEVYQKLSSDRQNNVYFCHDEYRRKLFEKKGYAIRLMGKDTGHIQAQAMLTPCNGIFDFIGVVGAAASMIDIQNFPGSFAAISNFLINPKSDVKRGLAKAMIEVCVEKQMDVDFTGFICVSTNRAILKESFAAGCKIYSVTRDNRLDVQTYMLGISKIHYPVGDVIKISFSDEIVLANYFDMGYAVESINWVNKEMSLRQQVVLQQNLQLTA